MLGCILSAPVFHAGFAHAAESSQPRYSSKNWTPELIELDKASSAARNYAENNYGVGILVHLGSDIPSKNVKNGDQLGQLFVNRFAKFGIVARYFIAPNGNAPSTGITYHIGHLLFKANDNPVIGLQTAWDSAPKVIEQLKIVKELASVRTR